MPAERQYRCDGPNCKAKAEDVASFPFVLTMRTSDEKRGRRRGFHQWHCLVTYVGASQPTTE